MEDTKFRAELHSAKFTTHKDDSKRILRRVQFTLALGDFPVHIAEWLGDVAVSQRQLILSRDLTKFESGIDNYFAKATFGSSSGNAEADVAGINVVVGVVGKDGKEHEETTLNFEAFPTVKLLTWIASSLKEWVDVEMVASQRELFERELVGEGIRHAVERFKATIPADTTVTMSGPDGRKSTIEGAGEE